MGRDEDCEISDLTLPVSHANAVVGQMKQDVGGLHFQFLLDGRHRSRVGAARIEERNRSTAAQIHGVPAKEFHQKPTRISRRRPGEKRRHDLLERKPIRSGQKKTRRPLLQE